MNDENVLIAGLKSEFSSLAKAVVERKEHKIMRYVELTVAAIIGFGLGWLTKHFMDIDNVIYLPVNYPLKEI